LSAPSTTEAKAQDALLDGCYLLETDVPQGLMDAKAVDARYRDLQKVERNFRTVKTTFLEIRPIFLRKAERTKAHVFVTSQKPRARPFTDSGMLACRWCWTQRAKRGSIRRHEHGDPSKASRYP
jgi:hypothetical protein